MKPKALLPILLLLFCVGATDAKTRAALSATFSKAILADCISQPKAFTPVPPAKDSFWKDSIPKAMRDDYVKLGERYLNKPWNPIPDSVFAEFKRNGSRTNYENRSLELRRQMARLVMAEIMEHQGRFIKDICQGLDYFISEIWWGIPAHYPTDHPERGRQVVDLYNADTANLMAWTIYMLADELEQARKGICQTMEREINRRLLTPARTVDYDWKRRTNNWNTWICEDWLACVLLCEQDRNRQQDAVHQILQCMDTFYDNCPSDGGCDEGVAYWSRAAGSFFECLQLLSLATGGAISLHNDQKLMGMGSYIYKLYIGNSRSVNFADSYGNTTIQPNVVFPFGLYLHDSMMMGYAAYFAKLHNFGKEPSRLFDASLSRELLFLYNYNTFKATAPKEPLSDNVWLPELHIFTSRDNEGTTKGLYVAAKGGHNDESHNHNDIGNFIVYADGEPIIIDIGAGTYTAQTFSSRRYALFNCRSAYHNVPLINGCEQREGKQYAAKNVRYQHDNGLTTFTLDIAGAYPAEAGVKKWKRTIQALQGQRIEVTEEYKLSSYRNPTEIILISCGVPKLDGNDKIVFGSRKALATLHFDATQLTPKIERINHQDNVIQNAWQKKPLYRIRLTIKSNTKKGTVRYYIE